ncbi:competence/damage-inducible protein A [Uliginosibacterium sediminicola]|uniref:Molybdopterin-binding protein n=1 Tax=Uliginosibacterium sediminicola TaxID=2024550 RepID=A0ABU9YV70_9RHOO
MGIGVLIIGDEILSGRRADKHLAKAIELLSARGMALSWARYCGDDRPLLIETLQQSFATGDVVFSFGGIGATPDDHTRQAAAAALGLDIVLHPEAERAIREAIFARRGVEAGPQQLAMGEFPAGSEIIPNPFNQIPGFSIREHWFLPGFPQMSWPMMEAVLDTHYAHLHHLTPWAEASLAVLDTNESALIDLMTDLQERFGVTVFSLPNLGGEGVPRHIDLGAKGEPAAVEAAMAAMREALTARAAPWCELGDLPAA